MATKYSIIVEAYLNKATLQQQLDELSKGKTITITTQVVTDGTQIQQNIDQVISKTKPPVIRAEIEVNSADIQAKIDAIMQSTQIPKMQSFFDPNGEMNKQILTYNGALGETVVLTKTWVAATKEEKGHWVETTKYINEAQAAVKMITVAEEENAKITEQAKLAEQQLSLEIQKRSGQLDLMAAKNAGAYNSAPVQEALMAEKEIDIAYQAGTATRIELAAAQNNVNMAYQKQVVAASSARTATDDFTKSIEKDILKVAQWMVATTLIYGSLRQISEGVQYIKDLNVELTNIQLVTNMNAEQVGNLAIQYNNLARSLGVTTLAVTEGALSWQRQGKSIEDTNILLKASMMLSKLGNLDAATATDRLTASLNGYKLEAKDAMGIIDKLVNLDNNWATSVDEISEAMSRSANMAAQASVSYDELASYVTVVSSVTRKSAESIGESLSYLSYY
jgi:hypothetical protein